MKNKKSNFYKLLRTFIFVFITMHCLVLPQNPSLATIKPSEISTENDNQKIIQEIASAYYRKGDNIQYESQRRSQYISPEDITNQYASYLVCSGFTYATYYNAFNMDILENTVKINAYGKDFHAQQGHDDIVIYEDNEEHANNMTNLNTYHNNILQQLKVGDIISYYFSNSGHAVLVYDFEYDQNGNKTGAIILHSTPNFDTTTTKLSKGLSWNNAAPNSITNIDEGSIQYTDLKNILNLSKKARHFTVYRPLALAKTDSIYNHIACDGSGNDIDNYTCTTQQRNFNQKNGAISRIKYKEMSIEKTVDVFNGSVVEPGDILTYNIAITNNSNTNYTNVPITENIPTNLVEEESGNSQLNWVIDSIPANTTYNQKYSVKVKNDENLYGKEIVSTGTVAQIPSSTITNTIGNNLNTEEKSAIISTYNNLEDTYTGLELVNEVYRNSLEYNMQLATLNFASHHNKNTDSNTVKELNQKCNPYFDATNNMALLNTVWGLYDGRNEILNKEHSLARNVLNHYYSALFTEYKESDNCSISSISPKNWEIANSGSPETSGRSERAMRIYPETLQTGDILIYANTGSKKDDKDPVTLENGIYAFIWIEDEGNNSSGNFYGNNTLSDGRKLNKISGSNDKGSNNLQTLYGKDFYIILRPSLTLSREDTHININAPDTGAKSKEETSGLTINIHTLAIISIPTTIIFLIAKRSIKHRINFNRK